MWVILSFSEENKIVYAYIIEEKNDEKGFDCYRIGHAMHILHGSN